jgi:DNA polymerase I-like protein with 3'-5' exonuclease and polymerase domains
VTNSDVARRADEAKVSKAEARAQLKEEKRLAAVVEAQGEVLDLPAVVDRAGNVLPVTLEQAAAVVREAIQRSGALTVDVETSGYPVGHVHYELRSVQLGDAYAAVVLHPVGHDELIRSLLAEAPKLHAHSATADLVPLAYAGLSEPESAWERMFDTVIAAKLADPASDPGLKQIAGAVLREHSVAPAAEAARKAVFKAGKWLEKTETDTPVERSGWAQIATGSTAMLRYAASDVLDTAALDQALPKPEHEVYERERLAQRMTARITYRGVPIDYEHVQAKSGPHRTARAEAAAQIRATGIDNPGSSVQIGKALIEMGVTLPASEKSGRPSVTEDVLSKVAADESNPQAAELSRLVLEYRGHDKALSTYLDPYRLLCELGDGRARPTIYTLAADTGRMSSVRPNFQNIPRAGGFRASVTSDPGYLMIGADFSGVELRFAAALSQDPTLLAFLADGRDLHAEVARQVWGDAAGKAERYIAKRIVFGRLYGGGIATLAKQAGVPEAIAQSAVDVLDGLTPGLSAWSAQIRDAVKAGSTRFRSYSGRIIHLPREFPHKAPNFCIQGSAREVLIDAMIKWRDTRWGDCTLLPVHDELDVWVPAEDAEEATAELVRCMETEVYGVQIVADPSEPSKYWQDST